MGTVEALAVDEVPAEAIRAWLPWATTNGYRCILNQDGRVLLLLSSKTYGRRKGGKKEDNTVERYLASIEKTVVEVDRLIPPDAVAKENRGTIVVVGCRREHFASFVSKIGQLHPVLLDWTKESKDTHAGFSFGAARIGAWIENPANVEEWSAAHEIVHRVAAGLIGRHAEHLPLWLSIGLGWHVEERVMLSIYCFPYRAGFVSIYDHTDWHRDLERAFRKRKKQPLELEELVDWRPRRGYERDAGNMAFGFARFLADHAPESIAPLLLDLHQQIEQKRMVKTGEYSWDADLDYRLPLEAQEELVIRHVGDDYLREVSTYFVKGKRFKRKPEQ